MYEGWPGTVPPRPAAGRRRRAAVAALAVAALAGFGLFQYVSATQISAEVTGSELVSEGPSGSEYSLELEFDNPSLLALAAGRTEFVLEAGGRGFGEGSLDPFLLAPMARSPASGTFTVYGDAPESGAVRLVGTTTYEAGPASLDVPFVYHPTAAQAREFIR